MSIDVVEIARTLIRFDTSNPTSCERPAAEYVAGLLADAGLEPQIIEAEPGRTNVVARWPGADQGRDALLVHCHLDVVPAEPADWQLHPFAGEERDGCLWGRGAVDMKDMDAMVLATVLTRIAEGRPPARDVVLAFIADEEAGGDVGSHHLVSERPDLFDGVTECISEVGGFSVTIAPNVRIYPIQTAEKGMAWMRLTAHGRAGHGSMVNDANAVTRLAEAVARIGAHQFPIVLTDSTRGLLDGVSAARGVPGVGSVDEQLTSLGPISRMLHATVRNTLNPTMLDAGYKVNVIPGSAHAHVDGRFLPGQEDEFHRTVAELAGPDVDVEILHSDIALETSFDGHLVEAMCAALIAEDPGAHPLPYMMSGGTDSKAFARLGIRAFGFSPLRLPAELDFSGMFHGVDERVPLDALRFGTRVLDRLFDTC